MRQILSSRQQLQRLRFSWFRLRRLQWGLLLLGFLSFVSVLLVWFSGAVTAQTSLRDIQGHWAQPCIESLVQQGTISGYPDRTFRPDAPVTRAEFAALVRATLPEQQSIRTAQSFQDVASTYWAAPGIQYAYQTGFLSGYPGNLFKPLENIPRVQALAALAAGLRYRSTQLDANALDQVFTDYQDIPDYFRSPIAAATENGIVVNYPAVRQLKPNQPASRAEIAALFCRARPDLAATIPTQYVALNRASQPDSPPATNPSPVPTTNRSELRGVWITNIDSDVMFNRDRLSTAIQDLVRLNINTLYPVVWNWGYTTYPSQVAQSASGASVDPRPDSLVGRDALSEIVEVGHKNNLAVIPWFEFGFMVPEDSAIALRHPDWLTQKRDGSVTWQEGVYPRVWLNPFLPAVQQFLKSLILEVVSQYPVDGIQFDDHFGLEYEFGYDPYTVQLYRQEHQGNAPPADPQDAEWVRWRANKITEFLTQVFRAIKAKNENLIVGLSPNNYTFSYNQSLQDWRTWEQNGLIEELVLQVYRNSLDAFVAELKAPEIQAARRHIPVGVGILTGIKPRAVPIQQIQTQVQAVRNQGLAGVSFFFYETMWKLTNEPENTRKAGFQALFPNPVPRPSLKKGWTP